MYPVIKVAARAVEGHRSRSGSAADDEADDLRRRVSQVWRGEKGGEIGEKGRIVKGLN